MNIFFQRLRPNLVIGLILVAGLATVSAFDLPASDAKEIMLLVTGGVLAILKDLLGADTKDAEAAEGDEA